LEFNVPFQHKYGCITDENNEGQKIKGQCYKEHQLVKACN